MSIKTRITPDAIERKKLSGKINYLLRVNRIQEIYKIYKAKGLPDTVIHKNYIYPVYFISIASFREYLAVNAKKELRELDITPPPID